MVENPIPLKPKLVPSDAEDIASLWLDPKLGDALVDVHFQSIPVGKPKDFFRVCLDPAWRRVCGIYTKKVEGQIEEEQFLIAPNMIGRVDEFQRCTLVTVIYRDGSLRLWPLKIPGEDGKDNDAWRTARSAAKEAMDKWVKLVWKKGGYLTRAAQPGYAPEPDWSKVPPFDDLVKLAFGTHGIIRSEDHHIARDLIGAAPAKQGSDDLLS
jgi:hypothetical protein